MNRIHCDVSKLMTNHGLCRQQQRAYPNVIADALLDFGERRLAGNGCDEVYFTKRSWRKFSAYMGTGIKGLERYRNCYLIQAADGAIVTVAFRH